MSRDHTRVDRVKDQITKILSDAAVAMKQSRGLDGIAAAVATLAGVVAVGVIEFARYADDRSGE